MVKALLGLAQLARSVPVFELAGAGAIVVGVLILGGAAWALIAGGAFALLKSLDLALEQDKASERARRERE